MVIIARKWKIAAIFAEIRGEWGKRKNRIVFHNKAKMTKKAEFTRSK